MSLLEKAQQMGLKPYSQMDTKEKISYHQNIAKKFKAEADLAESQTGLLGLAKKVVDATGFTKASDVLANSIASRSVPEEQKQYIPQNTTGEKIGAGLQIGSLLAPVGTGARLLGGVVGKTAGNILAGAGAGYAIDAGSKLVEGKTGTEALTPGIGTLVGAVIPGTAPLVKGLGRGAKAVTKFGTAQITGLKPETVSKIINNGEELQKAMSEGLDRSHFAQEIKGAFDKFSSQFAATGKKYDPIRQSGAIVNVPNDIIGETLSKFGIGLKDGKIIRTSESVPMKPGDVSALQDVIDMFGGKKNLNANEFLNLRGSLSELAKFDATKSNVSNTIAKELRKGYDALGKAQIEGLAELDATFAPMKKLNTDLKKRLFTTTGELKDNAISTIANITGKGKEKILARVEEIAPGVGQRAQILKAIEDITDSEGQKVGTYIRAGLSGGAALTGNIPGAIAMFILGTPKVAVPLLRTFGKAVKFKNSIIESLSGKLQNGGLLNEQEQKAMKLFMEDKVKGTEGGFKAPGDYLLEKMKGKGGLSIQDVSGGKASNPLLQESPKGKPSRLPIGEIAKQNVGNVSKKNLKQSVMNEMADFTSYAHGELKLGDQANIAEIRARKIAQKLGLNPDVDNKTLANKFAKILEKYNWQPK